MQSIFCGFRGNNTVINILLLKQNGVMSNLHNFGNRFITRKKITNLLWCRFYFRLNDCRCNKRKVPRIYFSKKLLGMFSKFFIEYAAENRCVRVNSHVGSA